MSKAGNRITETKPTARSRVTNGKVLVEGVDGRSVWVRRMRDLMTLHINDLGGPDHISEAERSIVRRAATLTVELECLESRFATDSPASATDLDLYQRTANSLRRLLESVGIKRCPRDITPPHVDAYLAHRAGGAE